MWFMVFGTAVGLELDLLLLYYREGLWCDLWFLVLRWDRNWSYCFCIIGRVWHVTYGVWYCGGTGIGLIAFVLYGGYEMWFMVFVTAVGLELDLLLLYYRKGLWRDLWFLVLPWDWNWSFCCCVIGSVWDLTYGVW